MSLLEILADEVARERGRERLALRLARNAKQEGLLNSDRDILDAILRLSEENPELGSEIPLAINDVLFE